MLAAFATVGAGIYLFEFLRGFNITDATLPVLNTTIDRATDVLQVQCGAAILNGI